MIRLIASYVHFPSSINTLSFYFSSCVQAILKNHISCFLTPLLSLFKILHSSSTSISFHFHSPHHLFTITNLSQSIYISSLSLSSIPYLLPSLSKVSTFLKSLSWVCFCFFFPLFHLFLFVVTSIMIIMMLMFLMYICNSLRL